MVKDISDVVEIEITDDMKTEAEETAQKKADFTADTWLLGRTKNDRFKTHFMGDLAKLAVREFFDEGGIEYIEYDKIRTDNFRKPDPWDFKLVKNNKTVEVKSSCDNWQVGLQGIVERQNLLGYTTQKQNGDINIQVFFLERDYKIAYIMGWVTKDLLEKPELIGPLSHTDRAEYYKFPIRDTNPISTIKSVLFP